jgi:hypothetical protein
MRLELTGRLYGRLTVLRYSATRRQRVFWLCRCVCGTIVETRADNLTSGDKQSCGCLRRETGPINGRSPNSKKHGHSYIRNGKPSRAYHTWASMIKRCTNSKNKDFRWYGGRGITVCDKWRQSFATFLADMGEPPTGTSIDRFPDKNGNYEPGNCRWATKIEQANNTRTNRVIIFAGKKQSMAQWARELGISYGALSYRLNHWSTSRAMSPA